jgi:hypothetical protein
MPPSIFDRSQQSHSRSVALEFWQGLAGIGFVSYIKIKSPFTDFIDAAPAKLTMTQIKDYEN